MTRLSILTVGNRFPPAGFGGYERIWAESVDALRAAGHEVRILTTQGDAPLDEAVRDLRWYWHDHDWVTPSDGEALAIERHNAAVLARELEAHPPDVVSWWGMGGMSLGLVEQVRRRDIPAVGVVADGWMIYGFEVDAWMAGKHSRLRERMVKLPVRVDLSAAAEWLFVSEALRSRAPQLERTRLVHPGVDPVRFAFSEPWEDWAWRLLYVGRIDPNKGIADAITALGRLPAGATLTIDGRGDERHRQELVALAAREGVADRVVWQCSEPGDLRMTYATHDVIVFPSTWPEPWGLVPIEAMAVGRPVVATATGGTGEYFEHEFNGLRFPPGRPHALAYAVERLAQDPDLRDRLVARGRLTAQRFTAEKFERRIVEAHERAARGR